MSDGIGLGEVRHREMMHEDELNKLLRKSDPFRDLLHGRSGLGWDRPELRWLYESPAMRLETEFQRFANMPKTGFEQFLEEERRRKDMLGGAADPTLRGVMASASTAYEEIKKRTAWLRPIEDTADKLWKMSLEPAGRFSEVAKSLLGVNSAWEEAQKLLADRIAPSVSMQGLVSAHLSEIAQVSMAAQLRASQIDWLHLGERTGFPSAIRETLEYRIAGLTGAYHSFYDSLITDTSRLTAWAPLVSEGPARELLYSISSVGAILAPEDEEEADEEIGVPFAPGVTEDLLAPLGSDLLDMLQGARAVITSTVENPDRQRHLCISLRELMTQILHRVAPDDQVKQWTNNPSDFHQGNPTRQARLRYIARKVAHGPFEAFLVQDVKAACALFDILHKGTHGPTGGFTDGQMQAVLIRTEQIVAFLLSVDKC